MKISNKHTPFWLFAFSILIILTLPTLIKDGMFMDAMLYASVSHNLSQGIGTFWFPQFSVHNVAGLSSFHEQPPLVFGIQSIFYTIFGDSMYVERIYTFLMLCITAWLIIKFWKEIFRDNDSLRPFGWIPVLLWITIEHCFWSYSNNMHENTMGIFTLAAVYLIYKADQEGKSGIKWLIISGILIFLATLSKGIPGFFPIATPLLLSLIFRKNFKKIFIQTSILLIVLIILYGILLLYPVSRESLSTYFFKRALNRINELPTVDNRFFILIRLIMELLPQLILAILIFVIAKIKKIANPDSYLSRKTLFFMLMGLTASAPLMLTLVQKVFYMVPAFPFFAIGTSIFIVQFISAPVSRINIKGKNFRIFSTITVMLFFGTIIFSFAQIGKTSRNKDLLHDVYLLGEIIPKNSAIGIPSQMWNEWDLQCYLIRYFNISVESDVKDNYFLINKKLHLETPDGYSKVETEMVKYELYHNEEQ